MAVTVAEATAAAERRSSDVTTMAASFTLASYNILADSYVRPEYYPLVAPAMLEPAARRAPLLAYLPALGADVLCLQEVEPVVFDEIRRVLAPAGYEGTYARKGRKPDGVAVLARGLELEASDTLAFDDGLDGDRPSGHVALLVTLRAGAHRLVVACTHLLWDAPGTPPPRQRGARELAELLELLAQPRWPEARIVCGDLNAGPESHLLSLARGRGYLDAVVDGATCNSDRRAKRIDFLLHTAALAAVPSPTPLVEDLTPLPSEREPSDHVPVRALFRWV